MVDQNQGQVQVNGQPVMGGNPYDLIDNKGQVVDNSTPVSVDVNANNVNMQNNNIEQPVQQPVQQSVSQNPVAVDAPVQQITQTKPVVYKGPGRFTKKLVSFLAKLSGQPDPETGVGIKKPSINNVSSNTVNNTVNNTLDTNVVSNVPINNINQAAVNTNINTNMPKANPFDSIMGGVTGFLDKVEKKVETVAGVDLNAPVNKPVVQVEQQPVSQVVTQENTGSLEDAVPVIKNIVQEVKPVEEVKPEFIEETKADVVVPAVEKNENVPVQEEKQVNKEVEQTIEEKTPVEAVKTEIESVEKNENIPVNPISENIQFGQSTPA